MISFALLKTLILISGLLSVIRICNFNERNLVFEKKYFDERMRFIGFLTFLILFFSKMNLLLLLLINILILLGVSVTIFVTRVRRERSFRQEFVEFLDRLILQVRSGKGFRQSFEISNSFTQLQSQKKIQKIFDSITYQALMTQNDKFVLEIYHHLKEIDRSSQKSVDRLMSFRKKLKTEDDFRRRSGTLIRQIRIQVVFLSVFYLGLLVFLAQQFAISEYWKVYGLSLSLFLLGILSFFLLARRKTWKI